MLLVLLSGTVMSTADYTYKTCCNKICDEIKSNVQNKCSQLCQQCARNRCRNVSSNQCSKKNSKTCECYDKHQGPGRCVEGCKNKHVHGKKSCVKGCFNEENYSSNE